MSVLQASKYLAILGCGGHSKVVLDVALCLGYENIIFFDDNYTGNRLFMGRFNVVGTSEDLINNSHEYSSYDLEVIVAIGNNYTRWQKVMLLREAGIKFATLIHPRATVSRFATIAEGSVVLAGSVINPDAKIGQHNIINSNSTIEHDCILGNAVHLSPASALAGNVKIGDLTWVGIGACVRECTIIGSESIIAAGAAVVSDVPSHTIALGVPAKRFISR